MPFVLFSNKEILQLGLDVNCTNHVVHFLMRVGWNNEQIINDTNKNILFHVCHIIPPNLLSSDDTR